MNTIEKFREIENLVKLFYFGVGHDKDGWPGYCNQELIKMMDLKERRALSNIKSCLRNCHEDHISPLEGWVDNTYNYMIKLVAKYEPASHQTITPQRRNRLPVEWN